MNGAGRLCEVLLANRVDVCFANPGTSEMHFTAALDSNASIRCILGLAEGIVTGAADGYGRMARRPAATLLHTGPGLANGLANLHNARRARSPVLNIVGDHAGYHLKHNAPLTTDIESLARPMSDWVSRAKSAAEVEATATSAYDAAMSLPGVATLILPADSAWTEVEETEVKPAALAPRRMPEDRTIRQVGDAIRKYRGRFGLLVGGDAAFGEGLVEAGRVAARFEGQLFTETLAPRVSRGIGRVRTRRIPYSIDEATAALKGIDLLVLVGAPDPVAFFASRGKPSRVVHEECTVLTLAARSEDQVGALRMLAEGASPNLSLNIARSETNGTPRGALTGEALSAVLSQHLPEGGIVCDEGITLSGAFYAQTEFSAPHEYLSVTGGAIGIGIPLSTGASVACPDSKVINFQADGSGLYTLQGLWTQARERLDVLTIILSNKAYAILFSEMRKIGIDQIGPNATRMLSLTDPAIDWVQLANGMGVEAVSVDSCEAFDAALRSALARRGPFLIECLL